MLDSGLAGEGAPLSEEDEVCELKLQTRDGLGDARKLEFSQHKVLTVVTVHIGDLEAQLRALHLEHLGCLGRQQPLAIIDQHQDPRRRLTEGLQLSLHDHQQVDVAVPVRIGQDQPAASLARIHVVGDGFDAGRSAAGGQVDAQLLLREGEHVQATISIHIHDRRCVEAMGRRQHGAARASATHKGPVAVAGVAVATCRRVGLHVVAVGVGRFTANQVATDVHRNSLLRTGLVCKAYFLPDQPMGIPALCNRGGTTKNRKHGDQEPILCQSYPLFDLLFGRPEHQSLLLG